MSCPRFVLSIFAGVALCCVCVPQINAQQESSAQENQQLSGDTEQQRRNLPPPPPAPGQKQANTKDEKDKTGAGQQGQGDRGQGQQPGMPGDHSSQPQQNIAALIQQAEQAIERLRSILEQIKHSSAGPGNLRAGGPEAKGQTKPQPIGQQGGGQGQAEGSAQQ